MSQLINKQFLFNESQISIYGTSESPFFIGNSVAKLLGYVIAKNAIRDNVWSENKISVQDYEAKHNCVLNIEQKKTFLINEVGTYQLIFGSKLEKAKQFQKWVLDVLVEIRKTGQYVNKKLEHRQIVLLNEADLHKKTVSFIRNFFPQAIMNASLGENQITPKQRIESKMMGYTSGVADLIIYNCNHEYNLFCLEFKSPSGKGVISDNQKAFMNKMKVQCKAKTLISENYDEIIVEIIRYFSTVRTPCQYCKCKFKSMNSLNSHLRVFHRIQPIV